MIDRDEVDAMSKLLGVHSSDVPRDYLCEWLLAGLYGDSPVMHDRAGPQRPKKTSQVG